MSAEAPSCWLGLGLGLMDRQTQWSTLDYTNNTNTQTRPLKEALSPSSTLSAPALMLWSLVNFTSQYNTGQAISFQLHCLKSPPTQMTFVLLSQIQWKVPMIRWDQSELVQTPPGSVPGSLLNSNPNFSSTAEAPRCVFHFWWIWSGTPLQTGHLQSPHWGQCPQFITGHQSWMSFSIGCPF